MNPLAMLNVIERLRDNVTKAVDKNKEHLGDLKYLEAYFPLVWKQEGKITMKWLEYGIVQDAEFKVIVQNEDVDTPSIDFLKVKFRERYAEFEFPTYQMYTNFERNSGYSLAEYEKAVLFFSSHLYRYARKHAYPMIRIIVHESLSDRVIEVLSNQDITSIPYSERNGSSVIACKNGYLIENRLDSGIVQMAESLFEHRYRFEFNGIRLGTPSSHTQLRISDKEGLEVKVYASVGNHLKKYTKDISATKAFRDVRFILSDQHDLQEEEWRVILLLSFEQLWEPKENIHSLSTHLQELVKHRLARTWDIRPSSILNEEVKAFLLSGEWQEEDNYREKLIGFLYSLEVVDVNSDLVLMFYDGRLNGLKNEAFFIFKKREGYLFDLEYRSVFNTIEDAKQEMNRVNHLAIEKLNKVAQ